MKATFQWAAFALIFLSSCVALSQEQAKVNAQPQSSASNQASWPDFAIEQKDRMLLRPVAASPAACVGKMEAQETCDCGTNMSGSKVTKKGRCYSCVNPTNNAKCGAPYCEACTVVCDPKHSVPPNTPGPC